MLTPTEATSAGMRSVDDRRSNYGNTVTVQSTSVEQFNSATRLVELVQQSVQPLTVTWSGALLTVVSPSGGSYEQSPMIRISAAAGSIRQEYLFDALPGGQFSLPCSELSVDVVWDVSPQFVYRNDTTTAWRKIYEAYGNVQTGQYRVSGSVREGVSDSVVRYTQLLAQTSGLDAHTITLPVPAWANAFIPTMNAGWAARLSYVEQGRGYSVNDLSSAVNAVVSYDTVDLDRYQAAGISLPTLGDCVAVWDPSFLSMVTWLRE